MVFERFRRGRSAPTGRLSCYGKLPFHREFLRIHLDSDEGRWTVDWIDAAHHLIAAADAAPPPATLELRALLIRNEGRTAVASLVRPSIDGGGRHYPICVFSAHDASPLQDRWHLAPIWMETVWRAIDGDVLTPEWTDRTAFTTALEAITCVPEDIEAVAQRFAAAAAVPSSSPWQTFTASDGERARQLASSLVQLAEVQGRARGSADGIAVRIAVGGASAADGALRTAVWVRLFAAAASADLPCAAIIEARPRDPGASPTLYLFGREPTAADLATLLAGVGDPGIDDLTDPWESDPASERGRQLLAALTDANARCLGDLWSEARSE